MVLSFDIVDDLIVTCDTNIRKRMINLYNIFDILCKQGIKLLRHRLLAFLTL
jgi:hypothetical protein